MRWRRSRRMGMEVVVTRQTKGKLWALKGFGDERLLRARDRPRGVLESRRPTKRL